MNHGCSRLISNILLVVAMIFLLAACSPFSPVKTESSTIYVINTVPHSPTKRSYDQINLLVTMPETNSLYNTTEMAYTDKPYEIGYFVKSRWADTPSHMLQPLIIQALQNTHYFHAVVSNAGMGEVNFILNTQILKLQEDFTSNPSRIVLSLRVELINTANNQAVATKQITVAEFAPERTPYGGVIAANRATARALRKIADFCLQAIEEEAVGATKVTLRK